MWKTFARTTACIAVSAAALIVVTRMDATAAARSKTAAPAPETAEPKPAPSKAAPKPAPAPPAPKLTVASLPKSSSAAAHTTTTANPFAKSEDGAVTLPDWKGKRLSVVRREARKLGLNVTARDAIGDTVPADEAYNYRVRKQLTDAGTAVDPGSEVQVRVRMTAEAAEGY